jgi:hypothetical protein
LCFSGNDFVAYRFYRLDVQFRSVQTQVQMAVMQAVMQYADKPVSADQLFLRLSVATRLESRDSGRDALEDFAF